MSHPAAVLFATLAQPIIGMLTVGGFHPHDANVTADVLQLFALSSVPLAIYLYTLRGFYALRDTKTPFFINCVENAINIGLAALLFPTFGVQGLAVAWSAAYFVAAAIALVALRRRIGAVPGPGVATALGKALIATAAVSMGPRIIDAGMGSR